MPLRIFFALAFVTPTISYGQSFDAYVDSQDRFNIHAPHEKIYIHTDKPRYFTGDTIWLKGYILSSVSKATLDSSKLAYIELTNSVGEVVKRIMPACNLGLFSSHIALNQKFPQGQYLLRAYTRRLAGLGDSLFFKKIVSVIDTASEAWQIEVQQLQAVNKRLQLAILLLNPNNTPRFSQPLNVTVKNGNKELWQAKLSTNKFGLLHLDTLMDADLGTSPTVEIGFGKNPAVILPFPNPTAIADLQFLPEGGSFIAGKMQRLGFKAINKQGKGVEVSGTVNNSKGELITSFASIHKGMGIIMFTPVVGETYIAVLKDGTKHSLPTVVNSGTLLRLDNTNADSIRIDIDATPDLYNQPFHFAVTEQGISIASGTVRLNGMPFTLKLSKQQFVSGVAIATLYDKNIQPINERAALIWLNDGLDISIKAGKTEYQAKDSVHLEVQVKDVRQKGVAGSFSIAVIDTSQVKINAYSETILSRINLSSDLRGWVEDPDYYFKQPNPLATEALMLTQGWVSYCKKPQSQPSPYEKDFRITGSVINAVGKPLKNTRVNLYGKNGVYDVFFADTTTNNEGIFTFHRFPIFTSDSAEIMLRAFNKNEKSFNVGIQMFDEPKFPITNFTGVANMYPLILDADAKATYCQRKELGSRFKNDGSFMEEVVIKAKPKIPGSYNLNEDGGADQTIYKEVLDKSAKTPLLDFMLKNVKGLNIGFMKALNPNDQYLKLNGNLAKFIIDGVDIDLFYNASTQPNDYLEFLKIVLNNFNAEDIGGVEVMDGIKYASNYQNTYLNTNVHNVKRYLLSYIEITTRGGAGPVMQSTPGVYRLKPLYPTVSKEFYSPRYNNENTPTLPDTRSTVYWNSNIVTDKDGKANLSFYTSDNPGSYLIIIEGTDLHGGIGAYSKVLF